MRAVSAIAAAWFAVAMLPLSVKAEKRYEVYFVSVGSGDYLVPKNGDVQFAPLPSAKRSAREVAEMLRREGARFGILLTSDPNHLVGSSDVRGAIKSVDAVIAAAKPNHPFIIFYLAGHGVADGIGWNHFSLPGNFVYDGSIESVSLDKLSKAALYAGDIADAIEAPGAPYMMLLDTCSEGKEQGLTSALLTQAAQENILGTTDVVRFMNEFHQPNPVLFSVVPGAVANTVVDPNSRLSNTLVAPLERRMALAIDPVERVGSSMSLRQFVHAMVDPLLDEATKPAVTHAKLNASADDTLFFHGAAVLGKVQPRTGTAIGPSMCCARRRSPK